MLYLKVWLVVLSMWAGAWKLNLLDRLHRLETWTEETTWPCKHFCCPFVMSSSLKQEQRSHRSIWVLLLCSNRTEFVTFDQWRPSADPIAPLPTRSYFDHTDTWDCCQCSALFQTAVWQGRAWSMCTVGRMFVPCAPPHRTSSTP